MINDLTLHPREQFVIPGCCKESIENLTVVLRLPSDYIYGGNLEAKPQWTIYTVDLKNGKTENPIKVDFCPHCGCPLPEVRKSALKIPVTVCTDGGYYCNTCGETLDDCMCYPPELAWEVVKEP